LTIWEWAFEDARYSPLFKYPPNEVGSFINAATEEQMSFFQVKDNSTYLCTALLKRHGLRPGDTVSLFSHNTISYPVAMFAILKAGIIQNQTSYIYPCVLYSAGRVSYWEYMKLNHMLGGRVNGASPAYSVDEMASALRTADSKYIMTVPNSIEVALAAAIKAGIPKDRIFLLEGESEDYATMQQLLEIGKSYGKDSQSPFFRVPDGSTNDICGFLNFSSGTTGLPKAVCFPRNV
jgi:acyl-CoA synthetase (AMP-forming)/AMP-acid ligase II